MRAYKKVFGAALLPLSCFIGAQAAHAASVTSVCTGPVPNACPATLTVSGPSNSTATVTGACNAPIVLQSVSHLTNISSANVTLTGATTFTATFVKANTSVSATFQINLTLNGAQTCAVDPAFATLRIATGRFAIQTIDEIPKVERYINIANGDPGLREVLVLVNGRPFRRLDFRRLSGSGGVNLDAARVMTRERNTLTFIGRGRVGAFANILVSDGAPAATTARSAARPLDWARPNVQVEDNAADQAANAATQEIRLNVATSLDRATAQDAKRFQVTVKDARAPVTRVSINPGADSTALVLKLPLRSFAAGDAIRVDWGGLRGADGLPLSGHADLIAE